MGPALPSIRTTPFTSAPDVCFPTVTSASPLIDNFSVQLVDRQGRFRLLDKRKIARLTRLEKESLMPGDIAGTLSPDELQDLLAFLDRQRSIEANAGNEYSRP